MTTTVHNITELNAALAKPAPNNMTILCDGVFPDWSLKYRTLQNITIAAAPAPAPRPQFPRLFLYNSSGVNFQGIQTVSARIQGSSDILFDNALIQGNSALTDFAIHVQGGCDNIRLHDSEVASVAQGPTWGDSSNCEMVNVKVHNVETDGFFWGRMHGMLFQNVECWDFHPNLTGPHPDHPDAGQGTPGIPGSSNVRLVHCLADGGTDSTKPLQAQGFTCMTNGLVNGYEVDDCLVLNTAFAQGIMVVGARGGAITNCQVIGLAHRSIFNVAYSSGLTITGNVGTHDPIGMPTAGFQKVPVPTDGGVAILADWRTRP